MDTRTMTPLQFEALIASLLNSMGFRTQLTKQTGDGGIDIVALSTAPPVSGKYIIQCKRWSQPVGETVVRDVYGIVTAERANKGIVVTTSSFTRQAYEFAQGKPIELIDGRRLAELVGAEGPPEGQEIGYYVARTEEIFEQHSEYGNRILREMESIASGVARRRYLSDFGYEMFKRDLVDQQGDAKLNHDLLRAAGDPEKLRMVTDEIGAYQRAASEITERVQTAGLDLRQEFDERVIAPARKMLTSDCDKLRRLLDLYRELQSVAPPPHLARLHSKLLEESEWDLRHEFHSQQSTYALLCERVGSRRYSYAECERLSEHDFNNFARADIERHTIEKETGLGSSQ